FFHVLFSDRFCSRDGRPVGCHASHRACCAVSARPFGQRVSILTQRQACCDRSGHAASVAPLSALPASRQTDAGL
ncbi:hypothetical protein, partial [Escherichia coli]|uniref:hypothetical protein n=1 Tax=Escherichia coli TaxID=562 RepID=UPI001BFCCD21